LCEIRDSDGGQIFIVFSNAFPKQDVPKHETAQMVTTF